MDKIRAIKYLEANLKTSTFRIIILFLFCLLLGCQARNPLIVGELNETLTNTAIATPIQTTPTPFPTATTTITPLPSPSPNPTRLPEPYEVQKDCFALLPGSQYNANSHGILILNSQFQFNHEFLNLETGSTTGFPSEMGYREMQVSPDRKKVAYKDSVKNQIVVMTANNQLLRSIPWDEDWITLARWQNNENLLILTKELLKSDFPDPPYVLTLVNTITGQSQKLIPDYPHIAQSFRLPWSSGHTVYDPTLTRVVYAQKTGESEDYTLWDIPGKRELISLPAAIGEEPVWSPDGSTFIVFTHNGLSLVNRDGIILYAIDINKTLAPGSYYPHYSARDFRYSPDGNRVAFWLVSPTYQEKSESYLLTILDTRNGKVVDTCLEQGDYLVGLGWPQPQIVWSPDGNQVAVNINYHESENTWDMMIADVEQKNAVKVAENLFPVGWMVKMR